MKKLFIILITVLFAISAFAETKTFEWEPVTTDIEGNTITVTGYKLYLSNTSGTYPNPAAVTVATPSASVNVIPPGTYYAVVRAYNNVGESANSNEVSFIIAPKPPRSPNNLKKTN